MKIIHFIKILKQEINNICWPTMDATIKTTFTILITSILLSLILCIMDKTLFLIISSIMTLRF
ncbi:Protein translocase subunit SecE [Buchnera aphidicola (Takecallis arundicolens)]|uniref:preprotein translocase subunit SecE n=1 Tax=Buchnera aphidicola TaxID=9 RepID=UPI003464C1A0